MTFRLKCRNRLYKSLGKFDAISEFTEVAVRDFIFNARNSSDFDDYLQKKANTYKIKVNSIEQDIFRSRISQSYILSVYQSFELFLREFKEEHSKLYNKTLNLPETNDSLLIKIIQKVSSIGAAKKEIGESRLETFEYYRAIRNKYAHEHIKSDKIEKAFLKVSFFKKNILSNYPNLSAPNKFANINFDDFILLSRTIKDIADGLCNLIKPNNKKVFVDYYKNLNQFNKFNQKIERKRNAIKSDLVEKFGLNEELDQIIDKIVPLA